MKKKTAFYIVASILMFSFSGSVTALNSHGEPDLKQTEITSPDIRITSDTIDFSMKTSLLVYSGNVKVINSQYTLTCDNLFISSDKNNKPESMQVEGNVRLKTKDGEITCKKAAYSRSSGEFILEQDVTVHQENRDMTADKIIVMIRDGQFDNFHGEGISGSVPLEDILPDSETGNPKED